MRDIRSRISHRQGIELSNQQIQELAARRLEAILDPRHVKPALLDQLRRSAGEPAEIAASADSYEFEDTTLYDTHRGVLRFMRRLLNPILKLFFNPTPLIHALNTQARLNKEAAAREAERERRQAEWNALHYELLQRLVTEVSRVAIDTQSVATRIDSLAAKVDFNERRVRSVENVLHQGRVPQRPAQESAAPVAPRPSETTIEGPAAETGGDAPRRRRRRRRGRRGGPGVPDVAVAAEAANATNDADESDLGDEGGDDQSTEAVTTEGETVTAFQPAHSASSSQRPVEEPAIAPSTVERRDEAYSTPAAATQPSSPPQTTSEAPRDEPARAIADQTDSEPPDR